jgi:hypothetical protein
LKKILSIANVLESHDNTISDPKCETKGKNNRYLAAWSYADADENIIIKFY